MSKAFRYRLTSHRLILLALCLLDCCFAVYLYIVHETPLSWLKASIADDNSLGANEWLCFIQFALLAATLDQLFKELVRRYNLAHPRSHIPKIVCDVQMVLVYGLSALTIVLVLFDLSFKSLIATSSAIGLVLAYASRDFVADIVASLQIQTTGLARVGDWLRFQEGERQVSSQVIDLDQQLVTLEDANGTVRKLRNSRFLQMQFVNLTHNPDGEVRSLRLRLSMQLPEQKILDIFNHVMEYVISEHRFHPRYLCSIRSMYDAEVEYGIEYRCPASMPSNRSEHTILAAIIRFIKMANLNLRSQHLVQSSPERIWETDVGAEMFARLKACQEYGILKALSDLELRGLSQGVHFVRFSQHDEVLVHGDCGNAMYLLCEGILEVQLPHLTSIAEHQQNQHPNPRVYPGQCVGEMSLLTGDPYSATVIARTDVALIFIEKLEFAKLLHANDALASELSKLVANRSEMNMRRSDSDLAQPGLREKIYRKIIHFFGLKPHINAKKESSHKVLV